ncbi:ExeM/NucH family extracellular endonuclease [Sagittula salina]|uniref:ExeM/NucH family extracellular endonuclease n=1 Tax=Sagittula salina TaxID=2820268 RepID=A0A940MN33_9RHOB|nr:ExeM/NucH family extracellular endonuclease [Sagittula salina]MBP0482334.1 ExeM/NucH family extracellular endonuclease [Sagittula salina]
MHKPPFISQFLSHLFGKGHRVETIFGGFGDDDIQTGPGRARVFASFGDDTVTAGGEATVHGGFGDDVITAGDGGLTAFGEFGDDLITGGQANDSLNGGHGDDTIALGLGNDRVDGGRGFDSAIVTGSIADYDVWTRGRQTVVLTSSEGRDVLRGVEEIRFDDYTFYRDGRNNAVAAEADELATAENDPVSVASADLLANDRDFDGDALSVVSVDGASAAGAAVAYDGTAVTYTPGALFDALAEGETATDSFTYLVTDGQGSTVEGTVTVTITGTNDAPVLSVANSVSVAENGTAVTTASASDVDGIARFSLAGADAALFAIDATTGALSFVAAPDFEAPADANGDNDYEVTVIATDDLGATDTQDLTVTVTDRLEIDARINEIHYDNASTDVGEFVEVRVAAGADASVLNVLLYNGSNGAVYNTLSLPAAPTSTTGGYDYYLIELPANGLQNGAPDGVALVGSNLSGGTDVLEFLSYEGTMTAADGPAAGMTSTDIGQAETSSTPVGAALERAEDGDSWSVTESDTRGLNNDYEPPFPGRINEFHYDNASTDVGEFVEVRVAQGTDVSGASIELYNGNGGGLYNTLALPAAPASTSGGYDYYLIELPVNGLQNGSPDGLALVNNGTVVEFLSYEGTFTAADGTAQGMDSSDVGVAETTSTSIGSALERAEDGDTWSVTDADTRGATNDYVPPFPGRINEFHYDNASTDVGEFVEVRVVEGTDVSAASVVLYNGNGGGTYGSPLALTGALSSASNGFDYYLIELPVNGLQNGSPDGFALVNAGTVVEFLSYEGTIEATSGPALGLTSFDIGIFENGSGPVGGALARDEGGDSWSEVATDTRGAANGAGGPTGESAPYAFDFETPFDTVGWQAVSVDGDAVNTWYGSSFSGDNFAAVNAYGDSEAADDWLISPQIDISGLATPVARFDNTKNFDDTGIGTEVTFLWSADYTGGDPAAATWTELPFDPSTGGYTETPSGEIDLSGLPSGPVSFAFRYQSSGTGSGSSSVWQIDDFFVGEATVVPPPPSEVTLISTIQGAGAASAMVGQLVTVEAVVVGDFQDGSFGVDGDLNGFYLQEEDLDSDGVALTSEGIFVFDGALPGVDVKAGDRVRVTATVAEYFGETQLQSVSSVEVLENGVTLPTAATIAFPTASLVTNADGVIMADLEAYEGMLVTVPQTMTVSDLYDLGRYGEMGLSAQGLVETYTQNNEPDAAGFAAFLDEAAANTLIVDDGNSVQNPSVIPFEIAGESGRIAGEFDAEDALSAGDTVNDLTGVLRYSRGSGGSGDEIYRLNLTETAQFVDTQPRDTAPPDVGGSIKVSSFNVLNFFTSLGDEGLSAGPDGASVRGADNLAEFERQAEKLIAALSALDSDVIGLLEVENEIGDQNGDGEYAIGYIVEHLNLATGSNYQYVDPGVNYLGSDAIMVGMIYDADTVQLASGTTVEFLTDDMLAGLGADPGNPVFEGPGTSRVPLAATFEEIASGETFTVAVNHLKSKGSVSPFGDNAGTGDGTGNNNEARTQAAEAIATWLASDPTGSADSDVLIIGDLNAYAMEDPIQLLEDEGFVNMIEEFLGADEFELSFGFPADLDSTPQAQTFGALDYALASASLAAQITGVSEWRINATEASVIDYNTNFLPADQVDDLYNADPYRSSDHDPLIIGLNLGPTPLDLVM